MLRKFALIALAGLFAGCSSRVDLATAQPSVLRLLANDTTAFWLTSDANTGVGRVMSVPLAGGSPAVLADGQLGVDLAVDGDTVYWGTSDGHIRSVPVGGGNITEVFTGVSIGSIAVYGGQLFWFDRSAPTAPWGLSELTLGGGSAPTSLGIGLTSPAALRVNSAALYWIDLTDGTVSRRTYTNMQDSLASGQAFVGAPANAGLAVDSDNAYWYDESSQSLRTAALGTSVRTLYTHPGFPCVAPVLDDRNVYCAEAVEVKRVPLDGAAPSTLFSVYPDPVLDLDLLAVGGSYLVFGERLDAGYTIGRVNR